MAEVAFETLLMGRETTRGTPLSAPTHLVHMGGVVTPEKFIRIADESRGTLFSNYRQTVTRRGATFETTGEDADTGILPFILCGAVRRVTTPTTPVGAVNSRLWTFARQGLVDDIDSFTLWYGDPFVQQWRSAYGMIEEMTLESSAAEEDGTLRMQVSGMSQPETEQNPSIGAPAAIAGPLLPSQWMQLWIDTTLPAGTTPVLGRLISVTHTIRTGVTLKYLGGGPTANLGYANTGRQRVSAITTELRLEFPDKTQYNQWRNNNVVRVRVRHNGPLIEGNFYHYVEVDTYGPLTEFEWDNEFDSNRVLKVAIDGFVDPTTGTDLRVAVQNNRTVL